MCSFIYRQVKIIHYYLGSVPMALFNKKWKFELRKKFMKSSYTYKKIFTSFKFLYCCGLDPIHCMFLFYDINAYDVNVLKVL